ncbi:MAG: metallophosphoesterase family protein [Ignavibacteriales bacterium]|nr:metallophosphoesterase family protein [Ignavibacteriales bacterium]
MKLAIISDIHANLEALKKAFEIIEAKNVDEIISLGDIVDYGANPNECVALIESKCRISLLGNHDEAALDIQQAHDHFTELALASTKWTHKIISDHNRKYLARRPILHEEFNCKFVHSSPKEPFAWHYIITELDAKENFRYFSQPICFFGHSHIAEIFCDSFEPSEPTKVEKMNTVISAFYKFNPKSKYLINVGSIGQPRDFDWRLSFGIFDTEEYTFEQIRAEYDVHTASQSILDAKLPQHNAKRIFVGR